MTTHPSPSRRVRLGRALALFGVLAVCLISGPGDRAFSASPVNSGIDPLEILNLQVKNNVFIVLDTSGSMRWPVDKDLWTLGIDDPRARLYQAREAIKAVVTANQGKVNFGLGTYSVLQPPKRLNRADNDSSSGSRTTGANGGGGAADRGPSGPFVYVTKDPNARYFYDSNVATAALDNFSACARKAGAGGAQFGFFCENSNTYADFDQAGAYDTDAKRDELWRSFRNVTPPYPDNCIPGDATNPCYYYIESKVLRDDRQINWNVALPNDLTAPGRFVSEAAYTCPAPPAGLVGPEAAPQRPCVRMCAGPGAGALCADYYFTSAVYQGPGNCGSGAAVLNTVAACDSNNAAAIVAAMDPSLKFDAAGAPTATTISSTQPGITSAGTLTVNTPIDLFGADRYLFNVQGIRETGGTPLGQSLRSIQCAGTGSCPAFSTMPAVASVPASPIFPAPPTEAVGKQRNFVILLTDGDDNCTGWADAQLLRSARELYYNGCTGANNAASGGACGTNSTDPRHQAETFVIAFSRGVTDAFTTNNLARAGSGGNADGTSTTLSTCPAGVPCRNAFFPANVNELNDALNQALALAASSGEFSDQQSVTESVFEFASLATPSKNPLDPEDRYAVSVPILLQSTFELPDYKGHLNAFRRNDNGTPTNLNDDTSVEMWDAGLKLYNRVSASTNGMGSSTYVFSALYGNGDVVDTTTSAPKIRRRIFTTTQNGVNTSYTPPNLLNASVASLTAWTRVSLWPPTTGATNNAWVAPTATGTGAAPVKGILDTAMGLDALTTVAQVQALVPGACQGTVTADIHADCTSTTAGVPLARAKREAREIILAYIAGARVYTNGSAPVRRSATSTPTADRKELQFEVRPWIMGESTLAAPGVVTPPLLAGPAVASGAVGVEEYKHYRDGLRQTSGAPIDGLANGLGLRNPDRATSASSTVQADAAATFTLKPVMSVVYHATNMGLHAFRAGPCPTASAGSGLGGTSLDCQSGVGAPETGGEELWAFIPFDLLGKLPALVKTQTRSNKQYLLAAPVRFSDIFVPGSASFGSQGFSGVWRTILYFGRGQGGKYLTALDVTTPGPFTRHSLKTTPPIVVWNRGNPDTTNGIVAGPANNTVTTADTTPYSKMGETWSVPSVGFVTAASYTTARSGSNGVNFVLFAGSGYSDVSTQGKTFYVLDALTGDVIRSFDIADGSPAYPLPTPSPMPSPTPATTLPNALVASPVVYAEDTNGNSPSGYRFIGNAISAKAKTVYFGDLHSRIWRYDATSPASAPTKFFEAPVATVGNQPFATAISVVQNRPDATLPGDVLVYAEAGHDNRVLPQASKPFRAYGFKDVNGTRVDVFARAFDSGYRGNVQPAAAFSQPSSGPPIPVVFFAGTKFNPATTLCISSFDSVLVALKGLATVPGVPEAAFTLTTSTGDDDTQIVMPGKRLNAIRISGEGTLVIDQGLQAQNVPPPPGFPVPSEATSSSSSLVKTGMTPGTQMYKDLAATTVPYRIGSTVCGTNQ